MTRGTVCSSGQKIESLIYNDLIMMMDIEKGIIIKKDEIVNLVKEVLMPSVHDDARHILNNLRAIPEQDESLSFFKFESFNGSGDRWAK